MFADLIQYTSSQRCGLRLRSRKATLDKLQPKSRRSNRPPPLPPFRRRRAGRFDAAAIDASHSLLWRRRLGLAPPASPPSVRRRRPSPRDDGTQHRSRPPAPAPRFERGNGWMGGWGWGGGGLGFRV